MLFSKKKISDYKQRHNDGILTTNCNNQKVEKDSALQNVWHCYWQWFLTLQICQNIFERWLFWFENTEKTSGLSMIKNMETFSWVTTAT